MTDQELRDFEQWLEQARQIELDLAKKNLTKGQDPEQVLALLANRLTEKCLNPLYNYVKLSYNSEYNADRSLKHYNENYYTKVGPKSDHVIKED